MQFKSIDTHFNNNFLLRNKLLISKQISSKDMRLMIRNNIHLIVIKFFIDNLLLSKSVGIVNKIEKKTQNLDKSNDND